MQLMYLRQALRALFELLMLIGSQVLQHPLIESLSKKVLKLCLKLSQNLNRYLRAKEKSEFYDFGHTAGYVEGMVQSCEDILRLEMEKQPRLWILVAFKAIGLGIQLSNAIILFSINNLCQSFTVFTQGIIHLDLIYAQPDNYLNSVLPSISSSGAVYLRLGQDGTVRYWHASSTEIFGFKAEEVTGKCATSTFVPTNLRCVVKAVCTMPELYTFNLNVNVDADGNKSWFFWLNLPSKLNDLQASEINSFGWRTNSPRLIFTLIKWWNRWQEVKFKLVSLDFSNWAKTHLSNLKFKSDLQNAIKGSCFILSYQPQVNFDNKVVGTEALIRWNHPLKGMISPEVFIPFAERFELIEQIDLLVLKMACIQIKQWQSIGHNVKVAVNLSGKHLENRKLVKQVAKILSETSIPAELLEIEITESWLLQDMRKAVHNLKAIKSLGISVSIDDFGSGHSSWDYLTKLPFDTLKIDRFYISNLDKPRTNTILRKMIQTAQELGLRLVIEGIETSQQLNFLKEVGCDACQGYLFSKPLSADEFLQYLTEHRG